MLAALWRTSMSQQESDLMHASAQPHPFGPAHLESIIKHTQKEKGYASSIERTTVVIAQLLTGSIRANSFVALSRCSLPVTIDNEDDISEHDKCRILVLNNFFTQLVAHRRETEVSRGRQHRPYRPRVEHLAAFVCLLNSHSSSLTSSAPVSSSQSQFHLLSSCFHSPRHHGCHLHRPCAPPPHSGKLRTCCYRSPYLLPMTFPAIELGSHFACNV